MTRARTGVDWLKYWPLALAAAAALGSWYDLKADLKLAKHEIATLTESVGALSDRLEAEARETQPKHHSRRRR